MILGWSKEDTCSALPEIGSATVHLDAAVWQFDLHLRLSSPSRHSSVRSRATHVFPLEPLLSLSPLQSLSLSYLIGPLLCLLSPSFSHCLQHSHSQSIRRSCFAQIWQPFPADFSIAQTQLPYNFELSHAPVSPSLVLVSSFSLLSRRPQNRENNAKCESQTVRRVPVRVLAPIMYVEYPNTSRRKW